MTAPHAVIYGCEGERLTPDEKAFFADHLPWGFILFARNCVSADQVRALTAEMRALTGRADTPVLIDQEGGRVMRLKPPVWPQRPAMDRFGALMKLNPKEAAEAAFLGARLIAEDLVDLGINVNCVPMLDVPQPDANEAVIGDRALAKHPDQITALGREVMQGTLAGGVLPVIKHMPGHGRSLQDTHYDLPRVSASREDLRNTDFVPFKAMADAPIGMTAHIIYEAYDPDHPATASRTVISDVIRGEIGFDGLLLTDDLSMKALGGDFESRSRAVLGAGCDILLHCNGDMTEMTAVAKAAPVLSGKALARAEKALAFPGAGSEIHKENQEQRFAEILKPVMV